MAEKIRGHVHASAEGASQNFGVPHLLDRCYAPAPMTMTIVQLPSIFAAGPECKWSNTRNVNPNIYETFADFKQELVYTSNCTDNETPPPVVLTLRPNASWPDIVYYQVRACVRAQKYACCRDDVITTW